MKESGDRPARVERRSSAVKDAWKLTNEDMAAIAEQRREEGWDVVTMPAVHSSPVSKDQGDDPERFGLVHVIPDNFAEGFTEAYESGEFTDYLAYREEVQNSVFLVTELQDPDTMMEIIIASHYDGQLAGGMVQAAVDEGALYTHVKTIDGTELGSFRHEEYSPFIPGEPKTTNGKTDDAAE